MKRYIYIIIGIVVVAVIAILVLLFIKDRSSSSSLTGTTATTGSLPAVGTQASSTGSSSGGSTTPSGASTVLSLSSPSSTSVNGQAAAGSFGVLSNNPVLDYFVDANNNITAIQTDGQVITIANGQSSTLNSSTISDIISANFSYDGKKILVNFGNPSSPQASIFDATTKIWTAVSQKLGSPQWSPNSYQIAYLSNGASSGKESLSMINAANLKAGVATIATLNVNDQDLFWLSKNQFILSDKPSAQTNGSIWLFNSTNNTLTSLAYEANGAEAIWSRSTSTLGLVFSNEGSDNAPILQLETTAGNVVQQLSLITLPSKCLFNAEQATTSLDLYCGIPRSSSNFASAQLPDNYNMMALFTSDDIYKINTATGATQVLWSDQTQNIDSSDLKIFNGTLFFINRYNSKLYGLVLGSN